MKLPLPAFFRTPAQNMGQLAENNAYDFLVKKGLKPVARNYRCKYGEIDLILQDQETLVFIEVRYRKNTRYGTSAETVTASKQKKLVLAAQYFILNNRDYQASPCRFDVAALSPGPKGKEKLAIEWIKNAFLVAT